MSVVQSILINSAGGSVSGRIPFVLTLVAAFAVVGCGNPGRASVRGQLKYADGSPVMGLDGGEVVFRRNNPDGTASTATGPIDAQGRFVLGTERPGDGAALGKSQVVITPPTPGGDVVPPRVIDRKVESFETSGIEIEVKPGWNDLTITVPRPGKK
jgi:hypothetical protein